MVPALVISCRMQTANPDIGFQRLLIFFCRYLNFQSINQQAGLVCMHVHGRIIGAECSAIPAALLVKEAWFGVPVSSPHGKTTGVASSLSNLIMLKTPANRAWQSIWKHIILWLVIAMLGAESLPSNCLSRRSWNDWKAWIGDMHYWLWLLVLQWCSRWHGWLLSTIIYLILQSEE